MIAAALVLTASASILSATPSTALKYRSVLTREAQFVLGLDAPVPMLAAQIEQESGWRPGITAWDNGRGLEQFMDPTTDTIVRAFPELGKGDPYNPVWAIRAAVRYDMWLHARVKGLNACEGYAAALKAYNAGLGYVQQAQKKSPNPEIWFGITEYVTTRQTAKNFEYSRLYPRWILIDRQPKYRSWGTYTCEGIGK